MQPTTIANSMSATRQFFQAHYKFAKREPMSPKKLSSVPVDRNLPLEPHERLAQSSPIIF